MNSKKLTPSSEGTLSLLEIADFLGGDLKGDANYRISSAGTLASATPSQLSFFANSKYLSQLKSSQAGVVLLRASDAEHCTSNAIVVDHPYYSFSQISHSFETSPTASGSVHPSAVVANTAKLGRGVSIDANVVIGEYVEIGNGCQIGPNCVVEAQTTLGENCVLRSNVTLYHQVVIGDRVRINSGTVIGSDGFGFAQHQGRSHRIAQVGRVRIEDDVDIGACTSIDRGAIDDTIIETGVIIDNQVQIAHNVVIGAHSIICGCVGIAGSTRVGQYCVLAGQAGLSGHIELVDRVQVGMQAQVTSSILTPGNYASGTGLMPVSAWRRLVARFKSLDKLFKNRRI